MQDRLGNLYQRDDHLLVGLGQEQPERSPAPRVASAEGLKHQLSRSAPLTRPLSMGVRSGGSRQARAGRGETPSSPRRPDRSAIAGSSSASSRPSAAICAPPRASAAGVVSPTRVAHDNSSAAIAGGARSQPVQPVLGGLSRSAPGQTSAALSAPKEQGSRARRARSPRSAPLRARPSLHACDELPRRSSSSRALGLIPRRRGHRAGHLPRCRRRGSSAPVPGGSGPRAPRHG